MGGKELCLRVTVVKRYYCWITAHSSALDELLMSCARHFIAKYFVLHHT